MAKNEKREEGRVFFKNETEKAELFAWCADNDIKFSPWARKVLLREAGLLEGKPKYQSTQSAAARPAVLVEPVVPLLETVIPSDETTISQPQEVEKPKTDDSIKNKAKSQFR